jgi:hypothetical protein
VHHCLSMAATTLICLRSRSFAVEPGTGGAFGGGLADQGIEVEAGFGGQPLSVLKQCPAQSFEAGIAPLFKPPGLVEGGRGVGDDMEFVEGDACSRQVVSDTPDERRRHVDARGDDLRGRRFVRGQVLGKAGDRRGVASLGHEYHLAFGGIAGNGQTIVAAPAGGLVDPHRADCRQVGLSHGEIDIARTDRMHAVLGLVDQSGDRGKRHLLGQGQHQRLEQQGEAGELAKPVGFDLDDPPVGQLDPRSSDLEVAFVLKEVEVAQPLGLGVMDPMQPFDPRCRKPAAGDKSMPIVRTLRAASKSTTRTYHGLSMPRAASNSWFCIHGLLLPLLNAAPCRHSAGLDCRVLWSPSRVRCAGLRPPLTAPTGRFAAHPTNPLEFQKRLFWEIYEDSRRFNPSFVARAACQELHARRVSARLWIANSGNRPTNGRKQHVPK